MASLLDPDIQRILLLAGIVDATERDIAIADTMLMRANGNVAQAAKMVQFYRNSKEQKP